jgi:DNA polymerase-3 subunit epsilon
MKLVDPCGCFPTGRHYPGIAHLIQVRAIGVADELDPDAPWTELSVAFLDTETTGTDPRSDRIIELAIVVGEGGAIVRRHRWLFDPGVPISKEASEIHGIRDEDVRGQPSFGAAAAEIAAALGGALPAAYNASFDQAFLHAEFERVGWEEIDVPPAIRRAVSWLDPLVFAREFFKGQGESRALGAIAERLGVALERAHSATDDAEAGLKVLYAIGRDDRTPRTYAAMVREQQRLERLQTEAQRFWRK